MPDILIKNEIGEDIEYDGVLSISVKTVDGGTAQFNFGVPEQEESRKKMLAFLSDNHYSHYNFTYDNIQLVSSNLPDFGLWYLTSYAAVKLMGGENWSNFKAVDGGVLITSSSARQGIFFFNYETLSVEKLYDTGYNINCYHSVPGGYLLSGNLYGIYFYDLKARSVQRLEDISYDR